ncbi:uncharacterized protein LOC117571322 isoform X2 [Drosophila albomicans]|uniref:Elongation of very long chain fatty acids protein n=1 Tax=Drosophila albomicans TaxID=7291 RepID=A0A9C6W9V8_DROAB|nr:uncharacterized protein LOC117571322 isoform X2 [Drosophila albomicans]
MDDEQELASIEKLRVQFEEHKLHCELQREKHSKLIGHFKLDSAMNELNSNMKELRLGMNQLHQLQRDLSCWTNVDAIEELPSSISSESIEEQPLKVPNCSSSSIDMPSRQLEEFNKLPLVDQDQLVISCDSRPCLFANCRKRVDSQLLLLHYVSDHSNADDACNFLHSHKLWQDHHIVLSFDPRRCELQQQKVIGLLDYTGFNLPACSGIFSSFLSQELGQLQGNVQIVVLMCKTSTHLLADARHQVFVIWLVTPQHQLQLKASLRLCGRDAAVQANSTLNVRPVQDCPTTSEIMSTPTFMVTVLGIYLLLVTKIGPEFMLFRKPFQLKKLIITHNIVQVVSCIYVLFEILSITENNIILFWKCNTVEMTESRTKRHFSLSYFLFWLKLSELIETVIFVLRHKQNQVTKLHIFHHITTITLIYMLINYNENGTDALFPVFLNSIVHIVMYSYYLTAAVAAPSIVRALTPVKKSITMMQMTQFALIILHAILASLNCGVDRVVFGYFMVVIVLMFYGFYDFYRGSYKKHELNRREFAAASRAAAGEVPTKTLEVN